MSPVAAHDTDRAPAEIPAGPPLHELSPLFEDVQRSGIFEDGKTFADSTPRREVREIMREYHAGKAAGPPFDLAQFVRQNFAPPESRHDIAQHIAAVWDLLRREPDPPPGPGSSLLPLPEPYVVPGGRFREIYYWDSYFTMLGLRASGRTGLVASMVRNFAHLISRFGYVPNGNRTYYLSRSQPPFFALMVELLAEIEGDGALAAHESALRAEYDYWM
ncbi:MAG: trehalase family glycosidase, partial [Opitutaceae bacterium]